MLVCAPEKVRKREVVVFVDNQGSVDCYRKGWSVTCDLMNTVLRALFLVQSSLLCKLWVTKVGRCSSRETVAADAVSKADWKRLVSNMKEMDGVASRKVPESLLQWIRNPRPDRELGMKIVRDMGKRNEMMQYSVNL